MRVTASELNVRSGPGLSFRILGTLRRDTEVEVREEHDGWVWVLADEELAGWVARRFLDETARVEILGPPQGLAAIKAFFGPPGGPDASAGIVLLPAPLKLGWKPQEIRKFNCHVRLEGVFHRVFKRIHSAGLWGELKTFDGCYENRPIKGSVKRSTHAWGIAVDLNAKEAAGAEGKMHPEIVEIFVDEGFLWGGEFSGSRRDPMHFQYATGY